MSINCKGEFAVQDGCIDLSRSIVAEMMEHLGNLGKAERPTCVNIELKKTSAICRSQNAAIRILPEMEGDMARFNGSNRSKSFVVPRIFNVIHMGCRKEFHVNIANDIVNKGNRGIFIGFRGTAAHLHSEK